MNVCLFVPFENKRKHKSDNNGMEKEEEEYQRLFSTFFKAYRDVASSVQETETEDELYDAAAVSKGMDIIYKSTQDDALWVDLYQKAAGSFLSEDPEVGLPVLLSFLYLRHFIPLYHSYLEKDPDFLHNYQLLVQMFSSDVPSNTDASSKTL